MFDPHDPRWRWLIWMLRIASGIRLAWLVARWCKDHLL